MKMVVCLMYSKARVRREHTTSTVLEYTYMDMLDACAVS